MYKFADNITLSIPIFYSNNNVISELDNICQWCSNTGLSLNISKSKFICVRTCSSLFNLPVIYKDTEECTLKMKMAAMLEKV